MLQSNKIKNDKFINSNHREVITITKEMTKHRPTGSFYRANRAETLRQTSENHILQEAAAIVQANRDLQARISELDAQNEMLSTKLEATQDQLEEARASAHYDFLLEDLEIYNRRGFRHEFENEKATIQRERRKQDVANGVEHHATTDNYGVFFSIDADNLKGVNDLICPQEGDEFLMMIAKYIKKHCQRSNDLIGRWGGDEFVVFLPSVDKLKGKVIRTAIISDIDMECSKRYSHIGYVGISIGLEEVKENSNVESLVDLCKPELKEQKDYNKTLGSRYDRGTKKFLKDPEN